jgi:cell division protein FtsL
MTTVMGSTRRKREQLKRLSWLTEAQAFLGWVIILILVALLGSIYLNQASRIATVGRRVQVLQNELERLKRENALFDRQVAEAQSLDRLQRRAIEMGFVPARPSDIEYLVVPDYPIIPNKEPESDAEPGKSLLPKESEPPRNMSVAIWSTLKAGVGDFIYGEAGE